jgi:hypothetical protein
MWRARIGRKVEKKAAMGCLCTLYGKDDTDQAGQQEWANDVCPKCGKTFNQGDHVVVDEDNTVYHYDCFEGPKPPFEEGTII